MLVAVGGISAPASAFELLPMVQEFDPAGRGANKTFRLDNPGDEPVAVSISITSRDVDLDGKETNVESEDFIVVPPQAVIPPQRSQVVRVQWVGDAAPTRELAFRIIAEQEPAVFKKEAQGASVQVVMRYIGSVYVVPPGVKPNVIIESAAPVRDPKGTASLEVILHNDGTAHQVFENPVLELTAGSVHRELQDQNTGPLRNANILAGGRLRVRLPWPEGLPVQPAQLAVKSFNSH